MKDNVNTENILEEDFAIPVPKEDIEDIPK